MKKQQFRHSLTKLRQFFCSAHTLIFFCALILQLEVSRDLSRFATNPNDTLLSRLSYSPHLPWRDYGLTLLTYPLVHITWAHFFSSIVFWFLITPPVNTTLFGSKYTVKAQIQLFLGYFCIAAMMALFATWICPANSQDRILGLSGLIMAHLGFMVVRGSNLTRLIATIATMGSFYLNFELSLLSHSMHAFGFLIGMTIGFSRRYFIRPSPSSVVGRQAPHRHHRS